MGRGAKKVSNPLQGTQPVTATVVDGGDASVGDAISVEPEACKGLMEVGPVDVPALGKLGYTRNLFIPKYFLDKMEGEEKIKVWVDERNERCFRPFVPEKSFIEQLVETYENKALLEAKGGRKFLFVDLLPGGDADVARFLEEQRKLGRVGTMRDFGLIKSERRKFKFPSERLEVSFDTEVLWINPPSRGPEEKSSPAPAEQRDAL